MKPAASPDPNPAGAAVTRHKVMLLALLACTILMVTLALLPLATGLKIGLIFTVAVFEACLVAGILMHLFSEQRMIHSVLVLTAIFFAHLLLLPILSHADHTSHFFK
jgi:hypothetical protein